MKRELHGNNYIRGFEEPIYHETHPAVSVSNDRLKRHDKTYVRNGEYRRMLVFHASVPQRELLDKLESSSLPFFPSPIRTMNEEEGSMAMEIPLSTREILGSLTNANYSDSFETSDEVLLEQAGILLRIMHHTTGRFIISPVESHIATEDFVEMGRPQVFLLPPFRTKEGDITEAFNVYRQCTLAQLQGGAFLRGFAR